MLSNEWLFYSVYIAVGFLIGILALPLESQKTNDSTLIKLLAFAAFWPYMLIGYAWIAVGVYIRKWRNYLDIQAAKRYRKNQ